MNYKILLFLAFANVAFPQEKFPKLKVGFNFGLNNATFKMPDNTSYKQFAKRYDGQIGNNFGINLRFLISKNLAFETGLKYYNLKSKTKNPELIFEDDFVVIDEKINYFDGKLFVDSKVEYSSMRIPFQISTNLLKSDKFNVFIFGGIFKDFVLNFKNKSKKVTSITPEPKNEEQAKSADFNLIQNYRTILLNLETEAIPDKQGVGFNFGIGIKLNKFEIYSEFSRPENTLNQGAIYRFNSTTLNIAYFFIIE